MTVSKRAGSAHPENPPAVPPTAKQEKTEANGTPYHRAAREYLKAGWSPILLPHKRKEPPPGGFTGYAGAYVEPEHLATWMKAGGGNVALRMPECVLGLDVDAYGHKSGAATLADAEARLGALPPTWRSTSREADQVSGIRYFRVPQGRRWADRLGPNV